MHVEFKDALRFLHENVGIVRYFHDIIDFQGFVIKDPQYVFDMITDLIVSTFTFATILIQPYMSSSQRKVYFHLMF